MTEVAEPGLIGTNNAFELFLGHGAVVRQEAIKSAGGLATAQACRAAWKARSNKRGVSILYRVRVQLAERGGGCLQLMASTKVGGRLPPG